MPEVHYPQLDSSDDNPLVIPIPSLETSDMTLNHDAPTEEINKRK